MPGTPYKTYADLKKFDFFRRPDWRWERVLKLADRPERPGRCSRRDDDFVRQARNFVLRWNKPEATEDDHDRMLFENPGLYYAVDYHRRLADEPDASMYVQARLLARQSREDIGKAMGIMPEAIAWYEALFFDVTDRIDQRDWITKHVIIPAMLRHNVNPIPEDDDGPAVGTTPFKDSTVARPFLDGSLKLFAYFGGVHVVDMMIAGIEVGKPLLSKDDMATWLDGTWTTTIRRRSSQAAPQFEINKYNVLELFNVHAQIIAVEKAADTADQNRTTVERHIKALVDEIPWAVGAEGSKKYAGTLVGRFDDMAGELRDDELLQLASGQTVETLSRYPAALPPPRKVRKASIMEQDAEL